MHTDTQRLTRVRAAMAAAKLDAIICRLPENVLMLSGYWPLAGRTFLLFPLEGRPVCIVPSVHEVEAQAALWDAECVAIPFGRITSGDWHQLTRQALRAAVARCGARRIGYEGSFETIAPPWNTAEPAIPAGPTRAMLAEIVGDEHLVDATDLLHSVRAAKTPSEQDRLRIANEISAFGLSVFAQGVRAGATGVELAAQVEYAIQVRGTGCRGAQCVRGFAQVSTGEAETREGYRMMLISTTRPLARGDLAMLELAVVADGFWCDRTRTHVVGEPTSQQSRAYDAIVRAQEAARLTVRPGVSADAVDAAARTVIRDAGYADGFFHSTGHGLGFRYHEPIPLIEPGVPTLLEPGMVLTLEPGIYLPGLGGMRLEDDFLVTASGVELLGPADHALSQSSQTPMEAAL